MRGRVTEKQALKRADWTLKWIPLLILFGGISGGFIIRHFFESHPALYPTIGGVAGFLMAWTWWSRASVKWKIWAFAQVQNPLRLEERSINRSYIYRRFHFLNKTEIASIEERKLLEKLYCEMDTEEFETELEDFRALPKTTILKPSKSGLWLGGIISLGLGLFWILGKSDKKGKVTFILVLLYFIFELVKQRKVKHIALDKTGVKYGDAFYSWAAIEHYEVCPQSLASKEHQMELTVTGDNTIYEIIKLDNYSETGFDVEKLLDEYHSWYRSSQKEV